MINSSTTLQKLHHIKIDSSAKIQKLHRVDIIFTDKYQNQNNQTWIEIKQQNKKEQKTKEKEHKETLKIKYKTQQDDTRSRRRYISRTTKIMRNTN